MVRYAVFCITITSYFITVRATACRPNVLQRIATCKALSSVRPSVCQRVDCDKTKETCAHILTPHETSFILVFRQEEWLVGETPST